MKNTLLALLGFILLATPLVATAQQFGDLLYTSDGSAITITGYAGSGGDVTIPAAINGLPVIAVGDYAFASQTNVTSVAILGSITTIGSGAFDSCTGLTGVTLSVSVTSIGDIAFQNCRSLTSVTIPSSVTDIGDNAFANCNSLLEINVDAANASYSSLDGVLFNKSQTSLLEYADGKTGGYAVPGGVTTIGRSAFVFCTNLSSVTIPSSVTDIGVMAFFACSSLTGVRIPGGCTNIGDSAFQHCWSLTNVMILNGVTSIGGSAFIFCTNLTSVTIPSSVTSIGDSAFDYCNSLAMITVDAANASYSSLDGVLLNKSQSWLLEYPGGKAGGYAIPASVSSIRPFAFNSCAGLNSVTIPDSVADIGIYAFENCTGLSSVTISDGVTTIEDYAFVDCTSLTIVTIPGSVTRIGEGAFDYCTNLTGVFFKGNAPSIGLLNVFADDNNATIYYLPGSTGWGTTFAGRPAFLWNPLMQSSGVGPAGFSFNITCTADIPIVIEATTSLANATWVPMQSLNLTNGAFYFSDPNWTNYPARFYRIRSPY